MNAWRLENKFLGLDSILPDGFLGMELRLVSVSEVIFTCLPGGLLPRNPVPQCTLLALLILEDLNIVCVPELSSWMTVFGSALEQDTVY